MEIEKLYYQNKEPFFRFAWKRFSVDRDTLEDIYQEMFIALYENIKNGSYQPTASIRTYLFQIGFHHLTKYFRDNSKYNSEDIDENISEVGSDSHSEDWILKQEITYRVVCEMEEPCNRMLSLFYYDRKSMEEIAREFNYSSVQSAKNRKGVCINRLQETLEDHFKQEGLTWKRKNKK